MTVRSYLCPLRAKDDNRIKENNNHIHYMERIKLNSLYLFKNSSIWFFNVFIVACLISMRVPWTLSVGCLVDDDTPTIIISASKTFKIKWCDHKIKVACCAVIVGIKFNRILFNKEHRFLWQSGLLYHTTFFTLSRKHKRAKPYSVFLRKSQNRSIQLDTFPKILIISASSFKQVFVISSGVSAL